MMIHLQVFENQIQRFMLLTALYRKTGADISVVIDIQTIPEVYSLGYKAYQKTVLYLVQEQLITYQNNEQTQFLQLTHKGIRAFEAVFRDVQQATEYFPAYREMMK